MIGEAIALCEKYYSNKMMYHALKVASYAMDEASKRKDVKAQDAYIVGLCHDLLENTDCTRDELFEVIGNKRMLAVSLLTKPENVKYEDYIRYIYNSENQLALLVKRADAKERLSHLENLTISVRDRYSSVLHLLL